MNKNMKKGNIHLGIGMFFAGLGFLLFKGVYYQSETAELARLFFCGAITPVVIATAVQSAIYFSRE